MPSLNRILIILILASIFIAFISLSLSPYKSTATKTLRKPAYVDKLEKQIKNEIALGKGANFKQIKSKISKLLNADPLNENALLYHANAQIIQEDWDNFDAEIFNVIRSRNPRNRQNLQSIVVYSLKIGDVSTALEAIDPWFKLGWRNRGDLLEIVDSIYSSENGNIIINDHLTTRPSWELEFLDKKSRNLTNGNLNFFTETIKRSLTLTTDAYDISVPISRVLYKLIQEGRISEAIDLWEMTTKKIKIQKFNIDTEPANNKTLNFNPDFTNITSPAPFNWAFFPSMDVLIERESDNVYISFSGKTQKTIAMQYFRPRLGPLSLTVRGDYYYKNKQGSFLVQLNCLTTGEKVGLLTLESITNVGETHKKELEGFKEDCPLASISLIAKPGIFNERISGSIRSIAVESREAK